MVNPPGSKSVNDLTQHYMKKYDKNGDGVIQLPQEQQSTQKKLEYTGEVVERPYFREGYKRVVQETTTISTTDIFAKADTNHNGLVGKDELTAYIQLFDENDDGVLNETRTDGKDDKPELSKFNRSKPETITQEIKKDRINHGIRLEPFQKTGLQNPRLHEGF